MNYYTLLIVYTKRGGAGGGIQEVIEERKDLNPGNMNEVDWIRQLRERLFETGFHVAAGSGSWEFIPPYRIVSAHLNRQPQKFAPWTLTPKAKAGKRERDPANCLNKISFIPFCMQYNELTENQKKFLAPIIDRQCMTATINICRGAKKSVIIALAEAFKYLIISFILRDFENELYERAE